MKILPEGVSSNSPAAFERLPRCDHQKRTETYILLCPTHRDDRELLLLARPHVNIIRHEYASLALEELVATGSSAPPAIADPLEEIERILARVSNTTITGIISTDDYPGSTLACVVAKSLGLPGADPAANLICQHKYYSRLAQQALVPEAVPEFALIDVDQIASLPRTIPLPAFIKPVKSFFSVGAQQLISLEQLAAVQSRWARLDAFFHPFERLLERFASLGVGRGYLIAEAFLQGVQCTLEGYACGDKIHVLGIVDSVMFPDTIAFQRFEYPSLLPSSVQDRMAAIARTVMTGLGFRNAMFNIEFIYDPLTDGVSIVEINPRMASQFADLYEKVDGFNTYSILLDVAAGREPRPPRREGPHRMAASCVLRTFQDMRVVALPSSRVLDDLTVRYPGIRVEVLASEGRTLSHELQDGCSFRYGIVNLGGRDWQDVQEKFEDCRRRLGFKFAPTLQTRAHENVPNPTPALRSDAAAGQGRADLSRHAFVSRNAYTESLWPG